MPRPITAPAFNCTTDAGMPLVTDARTSNDAVTTDTSAAPMGPMFVIRLPVVLITRAPKIEPPMPKHGAMMSVARSTTRSWFSLPAGILSSLKTIEAIGPAALATLFAPIANATKHDARMTTPFNTGCSTIPRKLAYSRRSIHVRRILAITNVMTNDARGKAIQTGTI